MSWNFTKCCLWYNCVCKVKLIAWFVSACVSHLRSNEAMSGSGSLQCKAFRWISKSPKTTRGLPSTENEDSSPYRKVIHHYNMEFNRSCYCNFMKCKLIFYCISKSGLSFSNYWKWGEFIDSWLTIPETHRKWQRCSRKGADGTQLSKTALHASACDVGALLRENKNVLETHYRLPDTAWEVRKNTLTWDYLFYMSEINDCILDSRLCLYYWIKC